MTNGEIRAMFIARREELGWTQHDLAVRVAVREAVIKRWEKGPWPPSSHEYTLRWGLTLGYTQEEIPEMEKNW